MSSLRDDIVEFSNELVELHKYPDYGPMGLQFRGKEFVSKIATAVSISKDVIEEAAKGGAEMLIVHHGMFWNNESRILDERVGGRLELLEKYGISVLAYHLALDANKDFGNNKLAAKLIGLNKIKPFDIGWGGEFQAPYLAREFYGLIDRKFHNESESNLHLPLLYPFGEKRLIKRVAVIVGGAPQYIVQAHREGYDAFLTGEAAEPTYHIARDLKMHFVAAGHDRTERLGVQKLGKILTRRFKVETFFIPSDENMV